jgi:NADH dehydrogenase (ubiquinone) 1 alpha subcomplex subunit 5
VHLRPYDPARYEKPSSKIKLTTGYAYLDVEPMPRARIMKVCYIILDKLAKEIPENVLYRFASESSI